MKTKKLLISVVLILSIFSVCKVAFCKTTTVSDDIIGAYFSLGRYDGEPIVWRAIKKENNGILLIADRIISLKAFDKNDDAVWNNSDIRQWLNCADVSVNNNYGEAGFLSEYNFREDEISLLLQRINYPLVNYKYAGEAEKGNTLLSYYFTTYYSRFEDVNKDSFILENVLNRYPVYKKTSYTDSDGSVVDTYLSYNLSDAVSDIDTNILYTGYQNASTEKIFLPSAQDVVHLANYDEFGIEYNMAKPTAKLAEKTEWMSKNDANWYYWLSDADSFCDNAVRISGTTNFILHAKASNEYVGVRPMCLVSDKYFILEGDGTEDKPFAISNSPNMYITSNDYYIMAGGGFSINFVSTPMEEHNIVYYLNDKEVSQYELIAKDGLNNLFCKAFDSNGNLVATSNELEFFGISYNKDDSQAPVFFRDFETGQPQTGFQKFESTNGGASIFDTGEERGKVLLFESYTTQKEDESGHVINQVTTAYGHTPVFREGVHQNDEITYVSLDFKFENPAASNSLMVIRTVDTANNNSGGFIWPISIKNGILGVDSRYISGNSNTIKIENDVWYNVSLYLYHKEKLITILCSKYGQPPKMICFEGNVDISETREFQLIEFSIPENVSESKSKIYYDNFGIYGCRILPVESDGTIFISDYRQYNDKIVVRIENPSRSGNPSVWAYTATYLGNMLSNVSREKVIFSQSQRYIDFVVSTAKNTHNEYTKVFFMKENIIPLKRINK